MKTGVIILSIPGSDAAKRMSHNDPLYGMSAASQWLPGCSS